MDALESKLHDTLIGKQRKLTDNEVLSCAAHDCNEFLSALFRCVEKIVSEYLDTKQLYLIDYFFDYISVVCDNFDEVNKDVFKTRLVKLAKKIERVAPSKSRNRRSSNNDLMQFAEKIRHCDTFDKRIKRNVDDEFISFLLSQNRNLDFVEILFDKMPCVMRINDEKGVSLYRCVSMKYLEAIRDNNLDSVEYYKKLLLLFNSKKAFRLPESEKCCILDAIYKELNRSSQKRRIATKKSTPIEMIKELKEIVTQSGGKTSNLQKIASKYGIIIDFDENIINLAKRHDFHLNRTAKKRKVISDYVISIDKPNTAEIDDALSCVKLENGHFLLGVHIASVLGYFDYHSDIVQNAFDRVHSIYFNHRGMGDEGMLPIFPPEFSTDIGALVEGKERLARSYIFEIDQDGNIVNEEFVKSIVVNRKQSTYGEIDKILKNGTTDLELQSTLNNLQEVANLLDKRYRTNEVYELVKQNNGDSSDLPVKKIGSEKIVYEAMLLTGNRVAEFFAQHNYPCLYKTHGASEAFNKSIESIIRNLVDTYGSTQRLKLYQLVNGVYPRTTYDISGRHDGLNLDHYCHCTSALRRAPDILVEYALELCYDKTPTDKELAQLEEEVIAKKHLIDSKTDAIRWFVQDVNKTYEKSKRS